ncbi:RNA helicase [Malassezia japonica]|uniref:RNA helicase n=1 Tax=Malassezia japonica TaxID=223818 RepID=A0AAF0EYU4_9BASI|nr:RNA helicase [Malassezia japonica]WFD37719.1 RNA helicase [Malassezia japonica]
MEARQVHALVDGRLAPLPAPKYKAAESAPIEGHGAPPPAIWARLAARAPAAAPPPPSENGAAALLIRHMEGMYSDRATLERMLQGAVDALRVSDAERGAEQLAELVGFEHLELVTALLANREASALHVARELAQRASGVGSSHEPLNLAPAVEAEQYPNVFTSGEQSNVLTAGGSRFSLPVGTTRVHESFFEEVTIPPSRPLPFRTTERLVPLEEMDALCKGAFKSYKTLNRLQSAVYPVAYQSNENMLVCAPTGAGKTDVAMLSVLRCVSRFARVNGESIHVDRDAFKIVYVAPMKALVSEIVGKFSKRLQYLGVKVRELTGDMQLTRREIAETQMIVTTPEKWDVVTRRPTGDGELALSVRLLIIDEVHLLHEDRGAVIETIVARTQRLVESTQSMIRIVGLSATLPNYVDVADFLGVNRYRGLFYFGSSFRPVPLEQHFIGVRGKNGSALARSNLDRVVYEKVLALAEEGHPVMVFVHTRKDTVKTAQALLELGKDDGLHSLLTDDRDSTRFDRDIAQSRNRELRELFEHGIGIHHAGMLRSDRDLAEKTFAAGATRVLCCTATLAWGVNLPAYAVIIKGTDVYNAEAGRFTDLGILDVLQIFGRAGRPQFEDVGVGYICTANEKMSHYIEAITSSHPIESRFLQGIVDALNAEVALGSVSSIADGVSWLGFTYLYTRLNKAPLVYGIDLPDLVADPTLTVRREHWVAAAARVLVEHEMVVMDANGRLHPTAVGRIASRYYLHYKTVGIFQERLRNNLREADALDLMSRATDFSQIAMRDSEEQELDGLLDRIPCEVPGGSKTSQGKVNILLQAHVSNLYIDDFALVSDSRYVAQNAGRILLALFDLALDRGYATAAFSFLNLAKSVEHRLWPFDHPLRQVSTLNADVLHKVSQYTDELDMPQIRALPIHDLGELLHANDRIAHLVHDAAMRFPQLLLAVRVRPRPDAHVRLEIAVRRDFLWDERLHGGSMPIIVWVEDGAQRVVYADRITLRNTVQPPGDPNAPDWTLEVDVPCAPPAERPAAQESYSVAWSSLSWLSADGSVDVSLEDVWCPSPAPTTPLYNLPLLALESCMPTARAAAYARDGIVSWNAIQTQVFHTVAHTSGSVLLCAPLASGKRTVVEMALWRARKALVIVPDDVAARAYVGCLAAHAPQDVRVGRRDAEVIVTTPWSLPSDMPPLVVLLDLHRLDAAYELAVMQLVRQRPQRMIATSACIATAQSVAQWLNIPPRHTYTFAPGDHPYPATLALDTVDVAYSDALVRAFIKPAYDHIKAAGSDDGPALLFVSSRTQCMFAARELIARLATDPGGIPMLADPDSVAVRAHSPELGHLLRQGVGVWHPGFSASDRQLVEELCAAGIVRIVLCPRETMYTLPMRGHIVLVLGTQYMVHSREHRKAHVAEYPVCDLLQMHSLAVRPAATSRGQCVVLCQQTRAATLARHLRTPLALESSLEDGTALLDALCAEVRAKRIKSREEIVHWLGVSFLEKRITANPVHYDVACAAQQAPRADVAAALSARADALVLAGTGLGVLSEEKTLHLTRLGSMAPKRAIEQWSALAEHVRTWETLPEAVAKFVRSKSYTDEEAPVYEALQRSIPRPVLEAVGATGEVGVEQATALVLGSWLADTQRTHARTTDALVAAVGGASAAKIAEARDKMLLDLLTVQKESS